MVAGVCITTAPAGSVKAKEAVLVAVVVGLLFESEVLEFELLLEVDDADPEVDDAVSLADVLLADVLELLLSLTTKASNSGSHFGHGHAAEKVESNRKIKEYNRKTREVLMVSCRQPRVGPESVK